MAFASLSPTSQVIPLSFPPQKNPKTHQQFHYAQKNGPICHIFPCLSSAWQPGRCPRWSVSVVWHCVFVQIFGCPRPYPHGAFLVTYIFWTDKRDGLKKGPREAICVQKTPHPSAAGHYSSPTILPFQHLPGDLGAFCDKSDDCRHTLAYSGPFFFFFSPHKNCAISWQQRLFSPYFLSAKDGCGDASPLCNLLEQADVHS